MGQNHPPVEFLVSSSNNSLEEFELARMNRAANLRKEMRQVVDEWVEAEVDCRVARWILECRRAETSEGFDAIAARIEPVRGSQLALKLSPHTREAILPAPAISMDESEATEPALSAKLQHTGGSSAQKGKFALRLSPPAASPQLAQSTEPAFEQGAPPPAAKACPSIRDDPAPRGPSRESLRPSSPSQGILECHEASGLLVLFGRDAESTSEGVRCAEETKLQKTGAGKYFELRKRYRKRNNAKLHRRAVPKPPTEPELKWRQLATPSAMQTCDSMEPALA